MLVGWFRENFNFRTSRGAGIKRSRYTSTEAV